MASVPVRTSDGFWEILEPAVFWIDLGIQRLLVTGLTPDEPLVGCSVGGEENYIVHV